MENSKATGADETSHHWDVLALCCIDGRFIKRTIEWITNQVGDVFDFRTEVGASKAIIGSKSDRERLFSVIETSICLHGIKEFWLIDHIDCGAYGGSKQFENETAEKSFHIEKLKEAAKIVKERFPLLEVKIAYASWNSIEVIQY